MSTCAVCGIDFDTYNWIYPDSMIQHVIRHKYDQRDNKQQSSIKDWIET